MAEWHTPADDKPGKSGIAPLWEDHYSPKYGRCFLLTTREVPRQGGQGALFLKMLDDPFERHAVATTLEPVPPASMEFMCNTSEDQHANCKAASAFIEAHMKD
jgi:hypothetical protein